MKNYTIGKKKFTHKDQLNFAKISCDYNHIHVDPLTARRTIHGVQIVHGINLLLTSLNYYFKKRSFVKFNKIRCIFIHAVKINKDVDFVLEDNSKNTIIRIISGSKIYALIILLKGNDLREKFTTNNEHYNIINKINKNYINKSFNKIKKSNRNYKINLYNFKLTSTYNNLKKHSIFVGEFPNRNSTNVYAKFFPSV